MLHRHIQSIIRKDGRNYVMSAEIAMAREMTFKNKLQKLSMESSSSTDPLHYQRRKWSEGFLLLVHGNPASAKKLVAKTD
ncbi:uncharacterized protein LOC141610629 isoform X2 [Silene latifolia]|uniref:uncharacterized protein LOC141610629 isoform X2 n=1 Tax=Silene latifolia TaxID=37657 RepID=UPI003D789315